MEKITAVVLAAGAGKRMHSDVHKQYMMLAGRPVLFYALQAFAESAVTDIVVVVGAGEIDYCRKEIVEKYHIQKVCAVVEGGRERYHSVYEGLKAADGSDYVLIHDGARPLVTADIISRSIACVREGDSCVVGMPVKDTIKVVGADGFAKETPERSSLWQVQTPQTFPYGRIRKAYEKVFYITGCILHGKTAFPHDHKKNRNCHRDHQRQFPLDRKHNDQRTNDRYC